ncbi:U4/U6.U5 snRNP associated protein [Malassezia sp. CBS 17886]|nr:U4/U6.U5 snRNP associated protein [Malassezia sp. CBS 17886]
MATAGAPRRNWDISEYTARGREREREGRERAAETDDRVLGGKGPRGRRRDEPLPKPTQDMQAHGDLGLDKNAGKTMMIDGTDGDGNGPGFYCKTCNRMCKDSVGYLDHINGRTHLRRLGQTTHVARATLDQVRARIHAVREERALGKTAEERYDFDKRLQQIAAEQRQQRDAKRQQRLDARAQRRAEGGPDPVVDTKDDGAMLAAMGFASFGSSSR